MNSEKLPKSVDIFGHKVSISRAKLADAHGTFSIDDKTGAGKIHLCRDITPAFSEKILFHELVHAALYYSGVCELLTAEQEEAIVRAMEHGIYPLYQRK